MIRVGVPIGYYQAVSLPEVVVGIFFGSVCLLLFVLTIETILHLDS